MPENTINEKPSLVQTSQGFSVIYKNRYLYSKYNPTRTIISTIDKLDILPNTFIIIASPVLWYGLDELISKLPDNCIIAALELDENLKDFCKDYLPEKYKEKIQIFSAVELVHFIEKIVQKGLVKRALRIDFSAGIQFSADSYAPYTDLAENIIAQFWKNRITLVRFGRLFARNIFKSLSSIPNSIAFDKLEKSISCPIVVFGAGESTQYLLDSIQKENLEKCYVIAVDAALQALQKQDIRVDAVVTVEAQTAINAYFIGSKPFDILFADLCSISAKKTTKAKHASYFLSEYAETNFLKKIINSNFGIKKYEPMGSVGLDAIQIALDLRKDESIPIFITGLDFSYSLGKTHTKGVNAHIVRLINNTRLSPIENYDAAFASGCQKVLDKSGKTVITSKALLSYAQIFINKFRDAKNLFDAGVTGLNLGIQRCSLLDLNNFLSKKVGSLEKKQLPQTSISKFDSISQYYDNEEIQLLHLKELLSTGEKAMSENEKSKYTLNELIFGILKDRDYLYIHFPDGYNLSTDISFLKRIRAEIDFFLKDIRYAKKQLLLIKNTPFSS
ncbi:MAG: DUF115 domain-containing protein [Treponema sp.]|nr:DUF115 domain-containing protein [Treponema sp.]